MPRTLARLAAVTLAAVLMHAPGATARPSDYYEPIPPAATTQPVMPNPDNRDRPAPVPGLPSFPSAVPTSTPAAQPADDGGNTGTLVFAGLAALAVAAGAAVVRLRTRARARALA